MKKVIKPKWVMNDGEYEAHYKGNYGFVKPETAGYRAYDGRFPRDEFGTGFLELYGSLSQATEAIENAWGLPKACGTSRPRSVGVVEH